MGQNLQGHTDKTPEASSLAVDHLQLKHWLRALAIAKILFEDQAYHTDYLDEIEQFVRDREIK